MPASFGTSWYALVTYTFEGGSRPIPQSRCPSRMDEGDPGEVGGVLVLLRVEVGLPLAPGVSMGKSDGDKVSESLSCAWSGRT